MAHETTPGCIIEYELTRTERAILYVGKDASTGEPVIAKLVRNDCFGQNEVAMLRTVAQASPDGPSHVVRLIKAIEVNGNLCMVLEPFDETLDQLDAGRMTPLALMSIAVGAAKGLAEMYRAGVVDDDVKPGNIAFKRRSGRVAHIDLDCARRTGEKPVGYTREYAAPEVIACQSSDTSPCYGWGRTMEFLACGKIGLGPDYRLDTFVPWVGAAFAELVARCCMPNPRGRPSVPDLCDLAQHLVRTRVRCRYCKAITFPDASSCHQCHRV